MKRRIRNGISWILAASIAFIAVNMLCFLYERPTAWFDTPNGPSPAGWRPNSLLVHGTEGYGIVRVDSNGYLNPPGVLAESCVLMMGSSHTQGKEVMADEKYSALVNTALSDGDGRLHAYNISCDGHMLPALIQYFPAAVEAFPEAGVITVEISDVDFSTEELRDALCQMVYDPQNSVANQNAQEEGLSKLKNRIKEYSPLLHLIKSKLKTAFAENSLEDSNEADDSGYAELLDEAMKRIRGQFDGPIVFIYHPYLILESDATAAADYAKNFPMFQAACARNGIDVIDMGPVFADWYHQYYQLPYGFSDTTPGTGHLNRTGHQLIARTLTDYLKEVG